MPDTPQQFDACHVMDEGEILNPQLAGLPLHEAVLYGDRILTAKFSKRLSCAIKHLPIRVQFAYNHSTEEAIERGIAKDPTLVLDGEIFLEGLVSAEEITESFERFLEGKTMTTFDDYLRSFDYDERKAMKIQLPEMFELYAAGKAQVIDIRFNEEYEAWHIGFGEHIPLNELPDRLDELDKGKTIVTMCPHYDRAEIARLFLKLKGFEARYLTDGMLGIVDYLRGDRAKNYMEKIR
ncbi:rhodanese-like domain-containing protein [Nitratifractor sp.]